jgi:Carboxypeptidase regulatory-like domain
MTPPQPATIGGVISDEEGRALAEVAVAFLSAPVAVPDIAALTGPDGRFAVTAPVPGTYTLIATADGYKAEHVTVRVEPGRSPETQIDVRMHRAE